MSEDRPQYQAERTVPTNAEIAEKLRAMSIASLEGRAALARPLEAIVVRQMVTTKRGLINEHVHLPRKLC